MEVSKPLWDVESFLKKPLVKKPLIKECDLPAELKQDAVDICLAAVEKHASSDLEHCAQVIKDGFDRKFGGSPWCVVAGKDFSFEVTHAKNYLLLFIGAFHVGILAWKL